MNIVDLGILVVIGFGLLMGWSRGLVGPLLAEVGFIITFLVVSARPGLVASILPGTPRPMIIIGLPVAIGLAVGIVGRVVLGVAFRLPLARSVDRLLGAAFHGALAFAVVYVGLLGVAGVDRVLRPINGVLAIRSSQVAAMTTLLSQYPQAGSFITASELAQLSGAAAVHPIPAAQLGDYSQLMSWYERDLRPQVAHSILAPLVVRWGAYLPVVGKQLTLPH